VVTLKKAPERIISLAPGNTEILFALGLADKVVGRTDYCDYPAEAKTKPSIGSFSKPSIEKIVALYADLILAANIHKDQVVPVLERLGFTVVTLSPDNIDEVLDSITLVGKATGKQAEATELTNSLSNRVKAVTDKTRGLAETKRPRVFYVLWYDPLMTSGNGTFQADLIQRAGGTNIAQNLEGWKTISLEAVITANPEVIIAGDMSDGGLNYQFATSEARLQNTDARKNRRVYWVNSDVASRPGPRIVDALELFARYIHLELFGSK
jgi:iron complex transport system substrate-binding protein